jgi:hypothetical protein
MLFCELRELKLYVEYKLMSTSFYLLKNSFQTVCELKILFCTHLKAFWNTPRKMLKVFPSVSANVAVTVFTGCVGGWGVEALM